MEAVMMTLGSGWVSGVRPYFMIFLLGLSGRLFGIEQVPEVLQRTDLLVIAGILLVVDFAADKIAFLDSFWDQLHTVIRPIAGGAIGYLLGGETDTTAAIVMAVLGAATALGAHATKATARAAVNVSPEPVSNALVSTGEDLAAVAVGVLTLVLPVVAGILALALVGAGLYLAYRIHRAYRDLKGRLAEVRARRAAGAEPGV
ncbi:DUF4126 domain-containing protein [Brachybacterium muris]|uniref:Membrane protein n=1 Tax=Brachybacterium muris UCD-AY4 TaxID=1249481 RepID=A0A022KY25_9MICO|nr:DUF4126 domain-containing protein [Brachybacterium muris]EYT49625.1 membrane protein [Brachybacterium muris UCD-AY4]MCT1999208.1 DUF4126 domain-containing protein [Brachybacterium muris]